MPLFNLREELQKLAQRVVPGKRIEIGGQTPTAVSTVKPGETTQTLLNRLGVGNIQFQQAQQAVKQGTGAFVPSAKPLTLGAGGVPVQTGIQPLPTGTQPISTQPSPLTITPQQLQQKPTQPITQVLGAQITPTTAVQGIQAQIAQQPTPQALDLQKKIEETKAKLEGAKAAQKAAEAGFIVSEKAAEPEKPAKPTGFEKYAEEVKEAVKPITEAYQKIADTLTNLPKSTDEYTRLAAEKGIPEAQERIKGITQRAYDVEAQIEALPEDVKQRVQDFLITNRQYQRLTEAEAKPLTSLYNALSRAQGLALQDLDFRRKEVDTMLGLVEKDTQRKQEALQAGLEMAKFGFGVETGLAKVGFEAETEAAKEAGKAPKEAAELEKIKAETEKLRRPEEAKTTSDITNYEFARQQGFTGSFEQWQATGKPGSILTQTQQNKFAIAGVPNNIALHIQTNLNQGATVQELKDGLTKDLGDANLASQYVDKFMETAQKSSADDLVGLLQQLSNL